MAGTVSVIINGILVKAPEGTTILEAAKKVQIKIPTLCKHPDLPPSAACGICVVKAKGLNKMLRACCTPIEEGLEITTHDPEIVAVRKNVLELILSNHPNDCLICGRNNNCELSKLTADFGIAEESFPKIERRLPLDDSTGAVVLAPDKCILCGRCIYVCQEQQNVWALSFLQRGISTRFSPAGDILLSDSPCIKCGQCAAHCPTGAIVEYLDVPKVWQALRDADKYCVAQIAPAVRASIGEAFGAAGKNYTGKLYSLLRRLGFRAVFDTSFSADVTVMEEASEFEQRLTKGTGPLPLITSCCPSWVDFMEKFHADMIGYFSSCKSPHEILGVLAKTYYAQKHKIDPSKIVMVSIMPCTSKKYEITRAGEMFASGCQDVDIVLTTRELAIMIKQAGIDFLNLPDEEADTILGDYAGAGVIFGATGGVMEAALRTAGYLITGQEAGKVEIDAVRGLKRIKEGRLEINGREIRVAVAHGMASVESVLDKVREAKRTGKEMPYHFIEVMACPGGCIGGGGQPYMVTDEVRALRSKVLYDDDRTKPARCSHQNPHLKMLYQDYLEKPLSEKCKKLLHTTYKEKAVYRR